MTIASPWFGPLYFAALCAALVAILCGRRMSPRIALALITYALITGAFCAGLAVRGTRFDVSGEAFSLPPAPIVGSVPRTLGPANGPDPSISVDTFGGRTPGRGPDTPLALKLGDSIEISGWAFDDPEHGRCTAVAAVSEGRTFAGTYGSERPDVGAALGEDHRFTGFHIIVAASPLGPGTHRIEIRCFGSAERSYAGPAFFPVKVTR